MLLMRDKSYIAPNLRPDLHVEREVKIIHNLPVLMSQTSGQINQESDIQKHSKDY